MGYSLPPISPAEKVKVGKTYKYVLNDEQTEYCKEWAPRTTCQELADAFHVSLRTMKSLLKSIHLTNNSRVERGRKEQQQKQTKARNQAKKIIAMEKQQQDATLLIATMPTGKDLNGIALTNEHRLAIDELKMASENPKANADFFARTQQSRIQQRREESEHRRKQKNITLSRKKREATVFRNLKKNYEDIGKWYPALELSFRHVAQCYVRNEDAQAELDIQGEFIETVSATGIIEQKPSPASIRAEKTQLHFERSISKLNTEIDKLERRPVSEAGGGNPFLKEMLNGLSKIE